MDNVTGEGTFSVYRNITQVAQGHVRDMAWVVERIRSGSCKEQVKKIRTTKDHDRRAALKADLTSICFAGTFRRRTDAGLIRHSGYMVADFDHVKDMAALRETLQADPITCLLFTSPSGDGLKLVVRIPPSDAATHKARFLALMERYDRSDFDASSQNVSRVCYESWDPDLYHNPQSEVFSDIVDHVPTTIGPNAPMVRLHSDDRIIERLTKWSERRFPIREGERNNNLFRLASAMNRCGVSHMAAVEHLRGYAQDGFTVKEIEATIKSAYRDAAQHGTQAFVDHEAESHIRRMHATGASFEVIDADLAGRIPGKEERKAAIEAVTGAMGDDVFWTMRGKNGRVSIDHYRFKRFLESHGYGKLYPGNGTTYVFVKVQNNLVENVGVAEIKDFVLGYIHGIGNLALYNHMAGRTSYFLDQYLSMLDPLQVSFVRDNHGTGILFYSNVAVLARTDGKVDLIDYADLSGYVWRTHVIDRVFERTDVDDGEFCRFIELVSSEDMGRVRAHRSAIGYLLHGFKRLSDNRAIIYNDAVINNNPNGGSGKGLISQAIAKVRRMSVIDGKSFSFDKGFPYQTVSADCQALLFDDVPKRFNFERLFSIITEGIVLEKKNKDAMRLSLQDTPKIAITTNYTIEGKGGSHDRRRWELEVSGHFNSLHTPEKEFGHLLFVDWDDQQWQLFDNYMVNCLLLYLAGGLQEARWESMGTRKLINATSPEFWEWVEGGRYKCGEPVYRASQMEAFVAEYPDWSKNKFNLTGRRWAMWLEVYGEYMGWKCASGKNQSGHYTTFHLPGDEVAEATTENTDGDEPF